MRERISIRRFLIFNLFLTLVVTTSLSAFANYYMDQYDIQNHLDNLLIQNTLTLETTLRHQIDDPEKRKVLEKSFRHLSEKATQLYVQHGVSNEFFHDVHHRFHFQVWDENKKLVLHTPGTADNQPLGAWFTGFSDKNHMGAPWRVFTHRDPVTQYYFMVAEEYTLREELTQRIIVDDIYIMLWIYPISGFLIWLIVNLALKGMTRIQNELMARESNNLNPLQVEDIPTEIQPLVTEINTLFSRLERAIERERRFAADAAHELKTPLAALKTQAQVALQTKDSEKLKSVLDYIVQCVDRSTHIVQQLLTLSRLSPERQSMDDCYAFSFSKLCADTVGQVAPEAIAKNIDISFDAYPENITMFGNIAAIGILVRNLVDNAVRYTQEGGIVNVTLLQNHEKIIELHVRDNGPGIPKDLQNRVFERFFRVLGNKSPGSGLGLAIVEQIAELHQATIELKKPEETPTGLEVVVIFPAETPVKEDKETKP